MKLNDRFTPQAALMLSRRAWKLPSQPISGIPYFSARMRSRTPVSGISDSPIVNRGCVSSSMTRSPLGQATMHHVFDGG